MTDETITCAMLLRLLAPPIAGAPLVAQVVNQKDEALLVTLKNGQRFAVVVSGPAETRPAAPAVKAGKKAEAAETAEA